MLKNLMTAVSLLFALATTANAEAIKVYTADTLLPFVNPETDELPGFNLELTNELAKRAGIEIEVIFLPWKRAQQTVIEGENALLIAPTRNAEREALYEWVTPLLTVERVFLTTGDPVNSFEEARGLKSIAARSVYYRALEEMSFTNIEEADAVANLKKLALGRVDAVMTVSARAQYIWTKVLGYAAEDLTIGEGLATSTIWLGGSPGFDAELMSRLDQANQELRADGTYEKLYAKYFGELKIIQDGES